MKEKTAAKTWAKLENIYAKKSLENHIYLKLQLYNLRMTEGADVESHISNFNRLICKLMDVDEPMKDEDQAFILLNSFPKSYELLKDSLCAGRETIGIETIISALQAKAMIRKSGGVGPSTDEALVMSGRNSERGGGSPSSRSKSKGK